MKEIIHKFLTDNFYMDLSTFSSYCLKESGNHNSIYLKLIYNKLGKIFGYEPDSDELIDIVSEWNTQQIAILTRKINHIKYRLYSDTGSDKVELDEMCKLIKEFEFE